MKGKNTDEGQEESSEIEMESHYQTGFVPQKKGKKEDDCSKKGER
jgi:hypothetical protein